MARNAIIMGASGRDFHNFNSFFRNNTDYNIICFTATQIPFTANRVYPSDLTGKLYPNGIHIHDEEQLPTLIENNKVQDVFFSYSDISHEQVMHAASIVLAKGASFHLLGPTDTMIPTQKPVIAVVGSRTGVGKSTISRKITHIIRGKGLKAVVIRHPMPYGKFDPVQRYETYRDLEKYSVTIEEREEYEQHIGTGTIVYAGVEYQRILKEAEKEGDVIIWDGGNNDFSFYHPTITITVVDPTRPGDELAYHPGETNLRLADIIVVNKVNVAPNPNIDQVIQTCRKANPSAKIVKTRSESLIDKPSLVAGKKMLVIEDGPSVTHGGIREGVGEKAAKAIGATLVDPRPGAVGSIKQAYDKYPNISSVLPALGYSQNQIKELQETVKAIQCDAVLLGTPADLTQIIKFDKPVAKVKFEAVDEGRPTLEETVFSILKSNQKEQNQETKS